MKLLVESIADPADHPPSDAKKFHSEDEEGNCTQLHYFRGNLRQVECNYPSSFPKTGSIPPSSHDIFIALAWPGS